MWDDNSILSAIQTEWASYMDMLAAWEKIWNIYTQVFQAKSVKYIDETSP